MKFCNLDTEFSEEGYRKTVSELNVILRNISSDNLTKETLTTLTPNMFEGDDRQLIEDIYLPAGTEVAVPHGLGVVPRYRIYLRMKGTYGVGEGTASAWTSTNVYFRNYSGLGAYISILLIK